MPLPEIGNKDESTYMKECVPMMINEGKDQEQAVAICMTNFRKSTSIEQERKPKSKIEVMSDIKKLFDKNGFSITDDKILEIFDTIGESSKFELQIHQLDKSTQYEIKVFPKKRVYIDHEGKYLELNDAMFDQIITNFKNEKLFKPFVDEQHKRGEKFGDILDLYKKDDGLYAKINLNSRGQTVVKDNIYSYVSPEWGDRVDTEKELHKNVLLAITLTNIPALEGENPKLQDQIRLEKIKGGNMVVSEVKEKLAKFEGSLNHKLQDAPAMPGLDEIIAMMKEMLAKMEELTGQKEVAEQKAEEFQAKLSKIEEEKHIDEKERFFESATRDGQIDPKEVEDWKLEYDRSKDFVVKMISMKPKKSSIQLTRTNLESKTELENIDYHVMDQMGYKRPDGAYDIDRYKKEVL